MLNGIQSFKTDQSTRSIHLRNLCYNLYILQPLHCANKLPIRKSTWQYIMIYSRRTKATLCDFPMALARMYITQYIRHVYNNN